MLYLGAVFGVIGGARWAAVQGLPAARVYAAMLLLFLPALVGARLLYVAFHWSAYRHQPGRIWRRTDGGAALYGGLIVSFGVSLPLLRALAIPLGAFWDAAAIAILIGMPFTRTACLLHGCCAGRPAESWLALYLPNARGVWSRRIPAQLLEAALALLILPGAYAVSRRFPFDGSLFLSSLVAYAAGRWTLEPVRDTIDRIGPWSLNRVISAGLVGLAATVFLLGV
jgi:phosphatidylglycerol:prolipoprotein diacylglycerol transferase